MHISYKIDTSRYMASCALISNLWHLIMERAVANNENSIGTRLKGNFNSREGITYSHSNQLAIVLPEHLYVTSKQAEIFVHRPQTSAGSQAVADAVAAAAAVEQPTVEPLSSPASVFPAVTEAPPYTHGSDSLSDEPEE